MSVLSRAALVVVLGSTFACGTLTAAANRDPRRCEQDPSCTERADKSKDCVTQCVDDPACIDRCREVTGQPK